MTQSHDPTSAALPRARRRRRGATIAAAVAIALPTTLAAMPAASAAPAASTSPNAATAATWLAGRFNSSGYIDVSSTSKAPDYSDTEQSLLAIASTGTHQATTAKALRYLEAHARAASREVVGGKTVVDPGLDAFLILDAHALKADSRSFGGVNLVTRLLGTIITSGPNKGLFGVAAPTYDGAYREGLSLAALAGAGGVTRAQVSSAINWTQKQECRDGAWEAYRTSTSGRCARRDPATFSGPDTNSTSLAVEGLAAWHATIPHDALGFLESLQNADGGWSYYGGAPSDADSTSVVRQALVALHAAHSGKLEQKHGTPSTLLASYQLSSGAFEYEPNSGGANLFATEQAVPAVELRAFPFVAP